MLGHGEAIKHHKTTTDVYVTKFTFSPARDCTGHNGRVGGGGGGGKLVNIFI
jgi:hypothetical protein